MISRYLFWIIKPLLFGVRDCSSSEPSGRFFQIRKGVKAFTIYFIKKKETQIIESASGKATNE